MLKIWKICFLSVLTLFVLFSLAFRPLILNGVQAEAGGTSWQDVFKAVIMIVIALAGSPVTQLLKNLLKIQDQAALLLTGVVSAGIAVLELWLSHVLVFDLITVDNFPNAFFMVFSLASIYFGLLKGTEGVFGKKLLLKPGSKAGIPPLPDY